MGEFDREKTRYKSGGQVNKNPYSSRNADYRSVKRTGVQRTQTTRDGYGKTLNTAGRKKVGTAAGGRRKRSVKKLDVKTLLIVAVIAFLSGGSAAFLKGGSGDESVRTGEVQNVGLASDNTGYDDFISSGYREIQEYCGDAVCEINGNVPFFTEDELSEECFERYSELDELGRCGTAFASLGKETLPTEERGAIGSIKPSGWHTVKYDNIKDLYLYNRCHLIAFCLSGENANEKNLITGTRYMNVEGMLPYETITVEYLDENPDNHVMYRVTPVFRDNNLIADGVLMEAYSVEDKGSGVSFCIWCYNVQPGIQIDYSDGDSKQVK